MLQTMPMLKTLLWIMLQVTLCVLMWGLQLLVGMFQSTGLYGLLFVMICFYEMYRAATHADMFQVAVLCRMFHAISLVDDMHQKTVPYTKCLDNILSKVCFKQPLAVICFLTTFLC
jgi:hypothetical protein